MENCAIKRMDCYVVTTDSGFAPNPYYGICTLACCKPEIRRRIYDYINKNEDYLKNKKTIADLGIWIVGVNGTYAKEGSILFAMQITEVLDYKTYWDKYSDKKPTGWEYGNMGYIEPTLNDNPYCGDNIYDGSADKTPVHSAHYQVGKEYDTKTQEQVEKDLNGKYVLISKNFVYFGQNYMENPKAFLAPIAVRRGAPAYHKNSNRELPRLKAKYNEQKMPMNRMTDDFIITTIEAAIVRHAVSIVNDQSISTNSEAITIEHLPGILGKPNHSVTKDCCC